MNNNNLDLEQKIKQKLRELEPTSIEIIDDSHKHIGHAGVKEHGGRHYRLVITSAKFADLNLIKRHQLVYNILADLLKKDIHALQIDAKLPPGI